MIIQRSLAPASIASVALLATGIAASAVVPSRDAPTDSLNVSINPEPHVYTLPANSVIYHGTYNDWSFKPTARGKPTWFGADRVTSAAMSYFRWCNDLDVVMTSWRNNKLRSTDGNFDVLNIDLTPKLMRVKTKTTMKFLFIPYGGYGHSTALGRVGYDQKTSLYGAGSDKGTQALNASGLCSKSVGMSGQTILPVADWSKATDKVVLQGWRAPWDQNEIAVCAAAATSNNLQSEGVETLSLDPDDPNASVPAALSQAYKQVAAAMGIDDKKNRGKTFKDMFLAADTESKNAGAFTRFFSEVEKTQKAVCSTDSPLKTKDVVGDKGVGGSNWFDIVFKGANRLSGADGSGNADVPATVGQDD